MPCKNDGTPTLDDCNRSDAFEAGNQMFT